MLYMLSVVWYICWCLYTLCTAWRQEESWAERSWFLATLHYAFMYITLWVFGKELNSGSQPGILSCTRFGDILNIFHQHILAHISCHKIYLCHKKLFLSENCLVLKKSSQFFTLIIFCNTFLCHFFQKTNKNNLFATHSSSVKIFLVIFVIFTGINVFYRATQGC